MINLNTVMLSNKNWRLTKDWTCQWCTVWTQHLNKFWSHQVVHEVCLMTFPINIYPTWLVNIHVFMCSFRSMTYLGLRRTNNMKKHPNSVISRPQVDTLFHVQSHESIQKMCKHNIVSFKHLKFLTEKQNQWGGENTGRKNPETGWSIFSIWLLDSTVTHLVGV